MNDKELRLIESIKSESRSSAEVKVKRAISQFVNDIGSAKVNGKSLKEIVLELDSEQIVDSLADALYEQTLDIESSAYQRNSNTPAKTIKNVQVQINGELLQVAWVPGIHRASKPILHKFFHHQKGTTLLPHHMKED